MSAPALSGLLERRDEIASKRLVVGFDGFIDTIVRPVKLARSETDPAVPFETIREFGAFLVEKADKSCSVELTVEARRPGGNMPLLARGAGGLGLGVTCIGMLGDGAVEGLFCDLPCRVYTFAPPGQSTCLEFQDGKVMLAADCELPRDPWELVLEATGGGAPALFGQADLIALVNWSELSFSQALWQSVYERSLDGLPADKGRFAFFDLCDVSRRTAAQIRQVLRLIGGFTQKRTTILSLNENEANLVAARGLGLACPDDKKAVAEALRRHFDLDEVLIHTVQESLLLTERGLSRLPVRYVEQPKILTGAGDNFNAASCFGAVMGLPDAQRLALADEFARFYIQNGRSAGLREIRAGKMPVY